MVMVSENTRLNIERARAALARARVESRSGAIRSPRPVDLSRLAELEERRERLEARSNAFRGAVRQRLGLSELPAERLSVGSVLGTAAMEGAICDAEVCAPPAPRLPLDNRAKQAALKTPDRAPSALPRSGKVSIKVRRKRRKFLGLF